MWSWHAGATLKISIGGPVVEGIVSLLFVGLLVCWFVGVCGVSKQVSRIKGGFGLITKREQSSGEQQQVCEREGNQSGKRTRRKRKKKDTRVNVQNEEIRRT